MLPIYPARPAIMTTLDHRNPYLPAVRLLFELGYSPVEIDHAFSWSGSRPGLAIICALFDIDVEDCVAINQGRPDWHARYECFVELFANPTRTAEEAALYRVLGSILGQHTVATVLRERYPDQIEYTDSQLEVDTGTLLAGFCARVLGHHDAPLLSHDGHRFLLTSYVEEHCTRLMPPPIRHPLPELLLARGLSDCCASEL